MGIYVLGKAYCTKCGETFPENVKGLYCPKCGGFIVHEPGMKLVESKTETVFFEEEYE